jgi:hypothetical protein
MKDVRGVQLSNSLREEVEGVIACAKSDPECGQKRQELWLNIKTDDRQFKFKRAESKVQKYLDAKMKPEKKLNTKAKETGVDVTDLISGKLQFSLITRAHIVLLRQELICHGLAVSTDFDDKTTITDLKKKLKKKLGLDEKAKSFEPLCQLLFDVCNGVIDIMLLDAPTAESAQEDGNEDDLLAYDDDDKNGTQETIEGVYELAFGTLKISNNGVHLLTCELLARGVEFDSTTDGILVLKRKLKESLGGKRVSKFKPQSKEIIDAIRNKKL